MKAATIFSLIALLMLASFIGGCVGKDKETTATTAPSVTDAPGATEAPAEDLEAQFPDVTETTAEDEITVTEPDLEADETVDLGSIL